MNGAGLHYFLSIIYIFVLSRHRGDKFCASTHKANLHTIRGMGYMIGSPQ